MQLVISSALVPRLRTFIQEKESNINNNADDDDDIIDAEISRNKLDA